MKQIAVIGHNRIIRPIVESIHQDYKDLETIEIEFVDTAMKGAVIEYIKSQIAHLDGIVFTGRRPFDLINNSMGISVPQVYIRHERSILLQTLLEAQMKEGYDFGSFSYDSYEEEDLYDAFEGFGMTIEALELYGAPTTIVGDHQVTELYDFHKQKYEQGLVSFCMTGVSIVYEKLKEDSVPCLLMQPTKEAVNNGIQQLWMKINAIESAESQIVVLSIEIDLPNEYNLIHDNEYQLMLEKARVSEQIYKFAEEIQAAVIETGSKNYMLFSTRQILELTTEQLHRISVLKDVNQNTIHTVSIGIGYGKTAREAKYNAALGINRALTQGGNIAFYVKDGQYSDPIYPKAVSEASNTIANPLYKVVSEETGISINNIYRLHCIKEKLKKDNFTSGELSEAFGNTRRSMNRIIEKLENAGYVEIIGKRMMTEQGRPTRIIRLKF